MPAASVTVCGTRASTFGAGSETFSHRDIGRWRGCWRGGGGRRGGWRRRFGFDGRRAGGGGGGSFLAITTVLLTPHRRRHRRRFFANRRSRKSRAGRAPQEEAAARRLRLPEAAATAAAGTAASRPASGTSRCPCGLHRKIHDPGSQHGSRGKRRHQFPIHVRAPSSALTNIKRNAASFTFRTASR